MSTPDSSAVQASEPAGQAKDTVTVKVYRPIAGPSTSLQQVQNLPESQHPTTHELAVAFSGQSKSREKLVDGPMLTSKLRNEKADKEAALKKSKYPTAKIRVKFADQTQLETTFSSSKTLAPVYDFVSSCLREDARSKTFLLYQTPPRREFRLSDPKVSSQSLLSLQLAPSSMLYIKFDDEALNNRDSQPPLLDELIAQQVDLPPPPTFEEVKDDGKGKATASSSGSTGSGEKKIPKWLKLGNKK